MTTTIDKLKKGDFFKVGASGSTVYQAKGYDRENKKYCGQAFNDHNKFIYKKKGNAVTVGFTF